MSDNQYLLEAELELQEYCICVLRDKTSEEELECMWEKLDLIKKKLKDMSDVLGLPILDNGMCIPCGIDTTQK